MSINSIAIHGGFYTGGPILSEETRQKLLALGIDPATVTSETHAKQKIAEVLALKRQSNTDTQISYQKSACQTQILSDAKALASQVGVSVNSTDDVYAILTNVAAAISTMEDKKARFYKSRLDVLEREYVSSKNSATTLDNMMSAIATGNKIALGL